VYRHRERPRDSRPPGQLTIAGMLVRFGFEPEDLMDSSIREVLEYKRQLDTAIAELNGHQYTPTRIAALSRRFGFHTNDLQRRNISFLLKAVIDSELYIDSLQRATQRTDSAR
jgi:hypothetical protein